MYDNIKVSILLFPQNMCSADFFCKQLFLPENLRQTIFFTRLLCANNFLTVFDTPPPGKKIMVRPLHYKHIYSDKLQNLLNICSYYFDLLRHNE